MSCVEDEGAYGRSLFASQAAIWHHHHLEWNEFWANIQRTYHPWLIMLKISCHSYGVANGSMALFMAVCKLMATNKNLRY